MNTEYIVSAKVTPTQVYAGDSYEIAINLVLGKDFAADGSRIILDMPMYFGNSSPSCYYQEIDGYMEVFCSNPDIKYAKKVWDIGIEDFVGLKDSVTQHAMWQRIFVLDFLSGKPSEGEEVVIKWGYTRDGFGVGAKIGTVVLQQEFYHSIHVRYFKDGTKGLPDYGRSYKGYDRPVPDVELPLMYRVLPREPEQLRLIRGCNKAYLQVLDRFSNICLTESTQEFADGAPADTLQNDYGVYEIPDVNIILSSKGLPIRENPKMSDIYNGMNIYFGDLHTHSMFSDDCIERGKLEMPPDKLFEYARKSACLDFLAVTDHHQPWDTERHKIGENNWNFLRDSVEKFNQESEFLAFPGFEFRCVRGDTAIVLGEDFSYDQIASPKIIDIRALWECFKGRDYIGIPHFHNGGELPIGEWYKCPYNGIEPLLEIYSCHGSYESGHVLEQKIPEIKPFREDRCGAYFLKNNYRYGFTCNSDGHKGNPGINGLTAVYATELTKEAILNSVRNRHVYGTTNARIRLMFAMNEQLMGSVLQNTVAKAIRVELYGERPFKAVDIFRNGELYRRFQPNAIDFQYEDIIKDNDAASWYVRATQTDNHIAYSSPIWFVHN